MNYQEQQKFLMHGRIWGIMAALLIVALVAVCLKTAPAHSVLASTVSLLAAAVLAVAVFYVPDYLHLSVDPGKRQRWETRVRWRVIGVALIFAFFRTHGLTGTLELFAAVAWLLVANWLGTKLRPGNCSWYFWLTDLVVLAPLSISGRLYPLPGVMLLTVSACLSILITENRIFLWSSLVATSGFLVLALRLRSQESPKFFLAGVGLFLSATCASAFLVWRAQKQNARNVRTAMDELVRFTGYTPDKVRSLWSDSNRLLAENWKSAAMDESDAARLAQWYRENSELYMFAISGYNLEYKRIRSNLKVLRFARGATLDYGAGNGEIVLELARRGHRVGYYDVEGETMKFARQRASDQGLNVAFFPTKDALLASSGSQQLFDTVFSFDVLEHIPDLGGELRFLSSLLNENGLFLFDVPAGSTKAHPMHLNHNLKIREHMESLGMIQERSFLQKLSFRKEEKFFFRKLSSTLHADRVIGRSDHRVI